MLNLPQASMLQFWVRTLALTNPNDVSTQEYALVIVSACVGGALHGVAMALRKFYGKGHEQYYLEWRWWLGTGSDAVAGCLLWPAMPIVPVQILVPLVIVVQLSSSYILGLMVFREKFALNHNLGLTFAIVGVLGVSMSTAHRAAAFPIEEFFGAWVSIRFMLANLLAVALLVCSYLFAHRSTFFALLSAVLEGLQYICSRTIVESLFDFKLLFFEHPAVLAAVGIKACCILGILHFQQQGLESDFSRFAGIFLVSCVMFTCIYGTAFFGDEIPSSFVFAGSSIFTLGGIWLLNHVEDEEHEVIDDKAELSGKDVEANYDNAKKLGNNVEASDDASIYEGEAAETGT